MQQYTGFADWEPSPDKPVILSGSPAQDLEAYEESSKQLTEADYKILERIAPRPIWERLEELRKEEESKPSVTERPAGNASLLGKPRKIAQKPEVNIIELPDGKVQIFYEFINYGGTNVNSSRDGGTTRRQITLKPANLKPIVELLKKQLISGQQVILLEDSELPEDFEVSVSPKDTVTAIPEENSVSIICDKNQAKSIIKLLNIIDQPKRQVEITARIFEVSQDFDFQLGAKTLIKHLASDNKQALASNFSAKDFAGAVVDPLTGAVPDPGSVLKLMRVFADAGITLDASFQALAETGLIRVVSSPRMTVTAGQTAHMLAGQELPIQSATIANDTIVTEEFTYKPIGVQLYITPQTVGPESVKLHVVTIVSAVSGFAPLPEVEPTALTNPILDSREAETFVRIPNKNTLVIGGLKMIRTVTREDKIPGLGDIKIIKWLFKNHRSQKLINDLYFFVTPKILR